MDEFKDPPIQPEDLKQRCLDFVKGAKWWEWIKTNATMWQSDQQAAYEAAKLLFEGLKEPWPPEYRPDSLDAERYRKLKAFMRRDDTWGSTMMVIAIAEDFDAAVDAMPNPAPAEQSPYPVIPRDNPPVPSTNG